MFDEPDDGGTSGGAQPNTHPTIIFLWNRDVVHNLISEFQALLHNNDGCMPGMLDEDGKLS